jgi:hypothetical protein
MPHAKTLWSRGFCEAAYALPTNGGEAGQGQGPATFTWGSVSRCSPSSKAGLRFFFGFLVLMKRLPGSIQVKAGERSVP